MLTQLSTLKERLDLVDSTQDALLTAAIAAVSARFDRLCRRTLARTVDAFQEFSADSLLIPVACYPIESVTRFELKRGEVEGWSEFAGASCVVRRQCVVALTTPLGSADEQGRLIYTGGFFDAESEYVGDFMGAFSNASSGAGLAIGSMLALVFTFIYFWLRGAIGFEKSFESVPNGFIQRLVCLFCSFILSRRRKSLGRRYENGIRNFVRFFRGGPRNKPLCYAVSPRKERQSRT